MDFIQAVVLGIVQGLTEFLPISSSGHLLLVPALLHWKDAGTGFTAVIQLGTVAATWVYFREDLVKAFKAWWASVGDKGLWGTTDAKIGWGVFFGTLPIIALGLPVKHWAEKHGFDRNIGLCAVLLIVLGIVLGLADWFGSKKKAYDGFKPLDGLVMGFWQALALFPGASRSGSTITGGLFAGLDRATAARVSFLLSVPSVTAAGLYELYGARKELLEAGILNTVISTAVSFIVGYWAVAFLIKFLQTKSLNVFVVYRVLVGAVILLLLSQGYFKGQEQGQEGRVVKPSWGSFARSSQKHVPSI